MAIIKYYPDMVSIYQTNNNHISIIYQDGQQDITNTAITVVLAVVVVGVLEVQMATLSAAVVA